MDPDEKREVGSRSRSFEKSRLVYACVRVVLKRLLMEMYLELRDSCRVRFVEGRRISCSRFNLNIFAIESAVRSDGIS